MIVSVAVVAGLALFVQEASPPAEPVTTLPPVEVVARATEGEVTLQCTANRDGQLSGCVIVSEYPEGQGFGEAALKSAGQARLTPRTIRGTPANASVRFTTRFRLEP